MSNVESATQSPGTPIRRYVAAVFGPEYNNLSERYHDAVYHGRDVGTTARGTTDDTAGTGIDVERSTSSPDEMDIISLLSFDYSETTRATQSQPGENNTTTSTYNSNATRQHTNFLVTCSDCRNKQPKLDLSLFASNFFPNSANVKSLAGQYEICPTTRTLHYHVLVRFGRGLRWKTVADFFERLMGVRCDVKYIKPADTYKTFKYVTKEETRSADHLNLNFILNPPKPRRDPAPASASVKQKKKSKDEGFLKWLMEEHADKDWWTIFHQQATSEQKAWMVMRGNIEKRWETIRMGETPRNKIETVTILYGASGVGKTTRALEMHAPKKHYVKDNTTGKWFDGITCGDEVLILEEMDGTSISIRTLLQLTDVGKYPPKVECKGKVVPVNFKHVVITSNRHPMTWYENTYLREPVRWTAFARRITECIYYPINKDDGTPNIYGNGEVESEPENLLEMAANMAFMGIAKQKTNMTLTTDANFQHYVNLMN